VRPGTVLAVASVLVVAALERATAPILVAVAGLLVGALIGLAVLQLGVLAGGLALRPRMPRVVIGVGPRITDWTSPGRSITLRAVPIMLSVTIGPGRAPVRPRIWGTYLVSAIFALATTAALIIVQDGPFWLGGAVGCAAAVLLALLPRRDAAATSTGWVLLHYLRLEPREAAEIDAAPLVAAVTKAVQAGDLPAAQAACDALAQVQPDGQSLSMARVVVLEAHGQYAEAMQLVLGMLAEPNLPQRDFALITAGLAGLAAAAVEAGQLEAELGLSWAERAITEAEQLAYPAYKLNGAKALVEVLRGNVSTAIALANTAIELGNDALGRADDLATLARAQMAAGDNVTARLTLGEAERIAAWWPRVAQLRARLDVT
jgi:tetratricopeptide (TPR) repeat protein